MKASRECGLSLSSPSDVQETAGTGIEGMVEGRRIVVGGSDFMRARSVAGNPRDLRAGLARGTVVVAVAVDSIIAGIITLADPVRPDAAGVLAAFRKAGIRRIVLPRATATMS